MGGQLNEAIEEELIDELSSPELEQELTQAIGDGLGQQIGSPELGQELAREIDEESAGSRGLRAQGRRRSRARAATRSPCP